MQNGPSTPDRRPFTDSGSPSEKARPLGTSSPCRPASEPSSAPAADSRPSSPPGPKRASAQQARSSLIRGLQRPAPSSASPLWRCGERNSATAGRPQALREGRQAATRGHLASRTLRLAGRLAGSLRPAPKLLLGGICGGEQGLVPYWLIQSEKRGGNRLLPDFSLAKTWFSPPPLLIG